MGEAPDCLAGRASEVLAALEALTEQVKLLAKSNHALHERMGRLETLSGARGGAGTRPRLVPLSSGPSPGGAV